MFRANDLEGISVYNYVNAERKETVNGFWGTLIFGTNYISVEILTSQW